MAKRKLGEVTVSDVKGENPTTEVNSPKEKLAALIEKYKVSNPRKYEIKKEALEAQLESLK